MVDIAHPKHRISQYAALWVGGFLGRPAPDLVLPVMLGWSP